MFKECHLRGSGVKCGPAVVTRWIFSNIWLGGGRKAGTRTGGEQGE